MPHRCICRFCAQPPQVEPARLRLPAIVRCGSVDAVLYNVASSFYWYFDPTDWQVEGCVAATLAARDRGSKSTHWRIPSSNGTYVTFSTRHLLNGVTDFGRLKAYITELCKPSRRCIELFPIAVGIDKLAAFAIWVTQTEERLANYRAMLQSTQEAPIVPTSKGLPLLDVVVRALVADAPRHAAFSLKHVKVDLWTSELISHALKLNASELLFCRKIVEWRPIPCPYPNIVRWDRHEVLCTVYDPSDTRQSATVWLSDVTVKSRFVRPRARSSFAFDDDALDDDCHDNSHALSGISEPVEGGAPVHKDCAPWSSTPALIVDIFAWLGLASTADRTLLNNAVLFFCDIHDVPETDVSFLSIERPSMRGAARVPLFCDEWSAGVASCAAAPPSRTRDEWAAGVASCAAAPPSRTRDEWAAAPPSDKRDDAIVATGYAAEVGDSPTLVLYFVKVLDGFDAPPVLHVYDDEASVFDLSACKQSRWVANVPMSFLNGPLLTANQNVKLLRNKNFKTNCRLWLKGIDPRTGEVMRLKDMK